MRLTELWERLDRALGPSYSRVWAHEQTLPDLNSRTVEEALAAGVPARTVWHAVWTTLELPDRDR